MIEFKKTSVSFIDNSNWIYFGHHEFSIFSLDNNELIYCEKEPFGKKYDQISNIVYSEENNKVIVITFKGDFCIYQIDHNANKVVKTFMHIQKGNFYCSDVQSITYEKDCITVLIEHKENGFLRSIFFDGNIVDSEYLSSENFKKQLHKSGNFNVGSKTIDNQLITIEIKEKMQRPFKEFPELAVPFIFGYVFNDGKQRIVQTFDEVLFGNKLDHLSSFNSSYISFVTSKCSLIVLPIKKD